MSDQVSEPEVLTVHCFWVWCDAAMTGTDVDDVHDRMEQHYDQDHRQALDAILGGLS